MSTPMRSILALGALAVSTVLSVAPPATAGGPTDSGRETPVPATRLRPDSLPRGADIRIPHVERLHTIVDGRRRIRVHAGLVRLLGRSGRAYVVAASSPLGDGHLRALRVRRDGGTKVLRRGTDAVAGYVTLSADGRLLVSEWPAAHGDTRLRAYSARTGRVVATRVLRGDVRVLDAGGHRVVLGGDHPRRTLWWNPGRDTTRPIAKRLAYAADIRGDRVALYRGDPYERGGCTAVTTLRGDRHRLWRSCRDHVTTFSPSGSRMTTSRGLPYSGRPAPTARLRRAHGRTLARYRASLLGVRAWEDRRTLLLDATDVAGFATVRCVVRRCGLASDVISVEY